MAIDYIPQAEPQLTIWLGNYKQKIATHGPTLGLTAGQIEEQQGLCDNIINQVNNIEQAKTSLENMVNTKKTVKKEGLQSIRQTANQMKANTNYTEGIGQDLGIKGGSDEVDEENIKPVLTAQATADGVKIKFTKKGLDGVKVYSRLKGAASWQYLATDLHSPYLDSRSVQNGAAETREYMVRGIINDEEVGQPSDIASVVFGGITTPV